MTKTAVVFSPNYFKHNPGRNHPESAKRLSSIIAELKRGQLSRNKNWSFISPEKGTIEQVELVHDPKYVNYVRTLCRSGGGLLDTGDTRVSVDSFSVALCAAGGALKSVDHVMRGFSENSFALVRPPGHHAAKSYGFGFCIFNNVAIAASHLLNSYKLKRVMILDVDSHHGNGTQSIFYETDKVLYTSLHEDPRDFPRTGFADEIGEHQGRGFNVNIPLPFKTSDQIYLKAFKEIVTPIAREYRPQFILVSAGFDSHYSDPVGRLALSAKCYNEIFEIITAFAAELCKGRLSLVLEGGYNVSLVGKLAAQALAKINGIPYSMSDDVPISKQRTEERGEQAIKKAKRVQRDFWHLV
jgi:acetoin utilization deacetylase AcuC-like enzyme